MEQSILIIDDSMDDILLTERAIARIGRTIRTETALSGQQGLELLEKRTFSPSLILLDLKLPGIDGLDVLHWIRRNERHGDVPVVIVTSSNLQSDREACQRSRANSFIHKSADLNRFTTELQKELVRWLTL